MYPGIFTNGTTTTDEALYLAVMRGKSFLIAIPEFSTVLSTTIVM